MEEKSILDDLGEEITGIIAPVTACMTITVFLVRLLNPDGNSSTTSIYLANMVYEEKPTDSTGEKLEGAFLNALVFVVTICAVTFLLFLLFKYKCYRFITGYMCVAVFNMFFFLTGALVIQVLQVLKLHIDAISFLSGLFNFSVVGVMSLMLIPAPLLLKQLYLIWVGVVTAYLFTFVPEWTSWVLLVLMAVYDIIAVLLPGGPLKALVELAMERNQDLPALVYESRPAGGRPPVRGFRSRAGATVTSPQPVAESSPVLSPIAIASRGRSLLLNVSAGLLSGAPTAHAPPAAAIAAAAAVTPRVGSSSPRPNGGPAGVGTEMELASLPWDGIRPSSSAAADTGSESRGSRGGARDSFVAGARDAGKNSYHDDDDDEEEREEKMEKEEEEEDNQEGGALLGEMSSRPDDNNRGRKKKGKGRRREGDSNGGEGGDEARVSLLRDGRETFVSAGPIGEAREGATKGGPGNGSSLNNENNYLGVHFSTAEYPYTGGGRAGVNSLSSQAVLSSQAARFAEGRAASGMASRTVIASLATDEPDEEADETQRLIRHGPLLSASSPSTKTAGRGAWTMFHDAQAPRVSSVAMSCGEAAQHNCRRVTAADPDAVTPGGLDLNVDSNLDLDGSPSSVAGLGDMGDEEEELSDGIKLGLGDFIFYSMLVGRAAMYDYMTVFSCYLCIVAGLGLTLLALALKRQALPALPFSIALGAAGYFLTRALLEPAVVQAFSRLAFF